MALSIKDEETDRLVRRLAQARKLSYTGAIKLAVSNELAKDPPVDRVSKDEQTKRLAAIREVQLRWREAPTLISASEIDAWMYDENGLPH